MINSMKTNENSLHSYNEDDANSKYKNQAESVCIKDKITFNYQSSRKKETNKANIAIFKLLSMLHNSSLNTETTIF